ncbi:MAG TPA: hypothetical protein PLX69_17540 [Leptospiraceae bacterium]|nr:hypothetical protein [Leptospiraceae bacterium]HRG76366.1 hypothetical protein [Leptospiraceae bacterium]
MQQVKDIVKEKLKPFESGYVKILIPVVILYFISILFYICMFGISLSNEQSIWGTFGDFLGGVFNPILSFITILLLIDTFKSQRQELQLNIEKNKIDDLLRLINIIFVEINYVLNLNFNGQLTIRDALQKEIIFTNENKNFEKSYTANVKTLCRLLGQLNKTLNELREIDKSSSIPNFYYIYFEEIIKVIQKSKYGEDFKWDEKNKENIFSA